MRSPPPATSLPLCQAVDRRFNASRFYTFCLWARADGSKTGPTTRLAASFQAIIKTDSNQNTPIAVDNTVEFTTTWQRYCLSNVRPPYTGNGQVWLQYLAVGTYYIDDFTYESFDAPQTPTVSGRKGPFQGVSQRAAGQAPASKRACGVLGHSHQVAWQHVKLPQAGAVWAPAEGVPAPPPPRLTALPRPTDDVIPKPLTVHVLAPGQSGGGGGRRQRCHVHQLGGGSTEWWGVVGVVSHVVGLGRSSQCMRCHALPCHAKSSQVAAAVATANARAG